MHPLEIKLRSQLRKIGVTRLLRSPRAARARIDRMRYRVQRPSQVEVGFGRFRAQMLCRDEDEFAILVSKREDYRLMAHLAKRLRPGETVWDIGANIGFYTVLAARIVGPFGAVVSFEPEPSSRARLVDNLALNGMSEQVHIQPLALGREDATVELQAAAHASAGTHRLQAETTAPDLDGDTMEVRVRRGDDARAEGLPTPAALKIDVEGFELDVLAGLRETLADPACHTVLCEVHFALLEARGEPMGALAIERALREAGFHNLRWPDRSHLLASK